VPAPQIASGLVSKTWRLGEGQEGSQDERGRKTKIDARKARRRKNGANFFGARADAPPRAPRQFETATKATAENKTAKES